MRDLYTILKGRKPSHVSSMPIPGSRRVLQINDLRAEGAPLYTTDDGVVVTADDILVAWDGAKAGTVGYRLTGNAGSTLAVLRPISSRTFAPYVGRFLQYEYPRLNSSTQGSAVPHVNRRVLEALWVPLPPLEIQQRIAAALETADAIRGKRQKSLQLLDDFLRSSYATSVGWRNQQYHSWPEYRIADLAEPGPRSMRTGPFGSTLRHSEFVDAGVAVLGIDNAVHNRFAWDERRFITPEKYQALKRYTVRPGDVLITIMGTTGRSAVVPGDIPLAISTKHLAVITVDQARVNPRFLSLAIHSDRSILAQISAANRGAIMTGLNLGIIKRLRLRVPPLRLQQRFADLAAGVDRTRDSMLTATREADALFESLAQRAFNAALR